MIRYSLFALLLVVGLFSCKKEDKSPNLDCRVASMGLVDQNYSQYVIYDTLGRPVTVQDDQILLNFEYVGDSVIITHDSLYLVKLLNADGLPTYINNGRSVLEFSYTSNGELDRIDFYSPNDLNVPRTILTDVQYLNGDVVSYNVLNQFDTVTNTYDTASSTFTYDIANLYYEYTPTLIEKEFYLLNDGFGLTFVILYNPQSFSKHLISSCQQFGNRIIEFDYDIDHNGRVERIAVNDSYGMLSDIDNTFTYDCY